jgi:hypothetical protein
MRRLLVALTSLPAVAASATTAEAAGPELGGGSTLFHLGDPSGAPCTAAFAATDSSGSPVLLAAGAGCSGPLYSGNVVEVGPVIASLPGDLAIVQVADPAAWTLVPWIGHGVTFTGRADPAVGAPVCLIEAVGVAGCGSAQAVDFSVEFPDGVVNPRRRDRRARRPGRHGVELLRTGEPTPVRLRVAVVGLVEAVLGPPMVSLRAWLPARIRSRDFHRRPRSAPRKGILSRARGSPHPTRGLPVAQSIRITGSGTGGGAICG